MASSSAGFPSPVCPFDPTNISEDGFIDYSPAERVARESAEANRELIVRDIPMPKGAEIDEQRKEDLVSVEAFFQKALRGQTKVKYVYNLENKADNNIKFVRRHNKSDNYKGDPKTPRPISVIFFEAEDAKNVLKVVRDAGHRNVKPQVSKFVKRCNDSAQTRVNQLNEVAPEGWKYRLEGEGLRHIKMVKMDWARNDPKYNKRPSVPTLKPEDHQNLKDASPEEVQQQLALMQQKVRETEAKRLETESQILQMKDIINTFDPNHKILQ